MSASGRETDNLGIDGVRVSGDDARAQNVMAAVAIANIVKSSFGPVGLDKMMVDDANEVMITNDGATILKQLDVEHPAAKTLVNLAGLQDKEVGDGTTSVVILAAELLKKAQRLVRQHVHPTSIMTGYRLACSKAVAYIEEKMAIQVSDLDEHALVNAAKTSMSSKIIGVDSDFFGQMCVDAVTRVKSPQGTYPINAINILKSHGKGVRESVMIPGFALNCSVASQAMVKHIDGARIACLDFGLSREKMLHGVSIIVDDPDKVMGIRQREAGIVKERIGLMLKAGANVILTTKGIDDLCLKYFVEAGAMAVRRVTKEDLQRISRATGATILLNLADPDTDDGNEMFSPEYLGKADSVSQERVADDELILIKGCQTSRTASIIFRGPNSLMLDEMERSMHDAICVVKRTLESQSVVPGGGAVDAALSIHLEQYATTLDSREQLAVDEYARAQLVIPKTLAVNAAKDATELVAQLRAKHHAAQTQPDQAKLAHSGLDLVEGKVVDNVVAGVLEPTMSKVKALQFATEAAVTLLRIDDLIKLNPKQQDPSHAH